MKHTLLKSPRFPHRHLRTSPSDGLRPLPSSPTPPLGKQRGVPVSSAPATLFSTDVERSAAHNRSRLNFVRLAHSVTAHCTLCSARSFRLVVYNSHVRKHATQQRRTSTRITCLRVLSLLCHSIAPHFERLRVVKPQKSLCY